jgi:hypothetical protein
MFAMILNILTILILIIWILFLSNKILKIYEHLQTIFSMIKEIWETIGRIHKR